MTGAHRVATPQVLEVEDYGRGRMCVSDQGLRSTVNKHNESTLGAESTIACLEHA